MQKKLKMVEQHILIFGDALRFYPTKNDRFPSYPSQVIQSKTVSHLPFPTTAVPRSNQILSERGEEEYVTHLACGELFIVVLTNYNRLLGMGYSANCEIVDATMNYRVSEWIEVKLGEKLSELLYDPMNRMTRLVCGGECVFVVVNDRWVFSRGSNGDGQLGINEPTTRDRWDVFTPVYEFMASMNGCHESSRITHMKAGHFHAGIVVDQRVLFMTGSNSCRQLGTPDYEPKRRFTRITSLVLDEGELINDLGLGGAHTVVLTTRGRVFTVGWNAMGELGDGTKRQRSSWHLLDLPFHVSKIFIDAKANRTIVMSHDGSQFYGSGTIDATNQTNMRPLILPNDFTAGHKVEVQGIRSSLYAVYDRSVVYGLSDKERYVDLRPLNMAITHLESGNLYMVAIVSPKTHSPLSLLIDRMKDHRLSDVSFLFSDS